MDPAGRERLMRLFRQTAADRVDRISGGLLALERGGGAPVREELARELHTLKGEARLLGYAGLAQVLHAAEDLLAAAAGGGVDELLRVCDAVPALLDGPPDGGDAARLLGERLRARALPDAAPAAPGPPGAPAGPAPSGAATIRVEVARLDELAALSGDLLMDGARARGRTRELAGLFGRWTRLSEQAAAVAERLRASGAAGAADRIERDVHILRSDTFRFLRRHADAVGAVQAQFARLAERVGEARLIPLSAVLAGLPRAARDLAHEQGKEVECTVRGGEVGVDRAILESLSDPLVHLLRNAVDHGLEAPAEREAAGKPRQGRLSVRARIEGEVLAVTVEDDGRGLDPEAVRQAALRRRLSTPAQLAALEGRALLDLVFLPGFSTREAAGEVSGRGVGLDVVRRRVTGLGGSVVLDSTPGRGTSVILRMPPSLALLRVLLVRVDEDVYGLPAADVEAVGRVDPGEVTEVAGARAVRHRGRLVPVAALGPMLGLNGGPRARRPAVAFLAHGREAAALVVDGLCGEREVAVKRPGAFLAGMPFVAGGAALEDGRVALLLSIPDLVAAARRGGAAAGPARERRRLRVLLVDDSAIARETEAALLRGLGHEVEEASDGEEAWRRLQGGAHHVLLTDVQMPGLDGIDLTRRVKRADRFARLPVVILSSLSAPEERRRGVDAGADAYLVKGELEPEALAATLERLCGGTR